MLALRSLAAKAASKPSSLPSSSRLFSLPRIASLPSSSPSLAPLRTSPIRLLHSSVSRQAAYVYKKPAAKPRNLRRKEREAKIKNGPKKRMKTHTGAAKRFIPYKDGTFKRQQIGYNQLNRGTSGADIRAGRRMVKVEVKYHIKTLKRLLPYWKKGRRKVATW